MHGLLQKHDWRRTRAALDLHQDPKLEEAGAYQYCFGDRKPFEDIARRVGEIVPLLAHTPIHAGYVSERPFWTDASGFLERYDGSLSELQHRLKVPHVACVETTTCTPLERADAVNLEWIRSFIALAARPKRASAP